MERDRDSNAKITTHFTCAINTENIKVVFNVMKKDLMGKIMDETFAF